MTHPGSTESLAVPKEEGKDVVVTAVAKPAAVVSEARETQAFESAEPGTLSPEFRGDDAPSVGTVTFSPEVSREYRCDFCRRVVVDSRASALRIHGCKEETDRS